jgi:hypothetical protein
LKTLSQLTLILVLAAVIGCSSTVNVAPIKVSSYYDAEADYPTYKTWDFAPYRADSGIPLLTDKKMRDFIINAITEELASRGLTQVTRDPDIRIGYLAATEYIDEEQLEQLYDGFDYSTSHFSGDNQQYWNKAALVLMAFDAKTGQMLWRGSAESVVVDDLKDRHRQERIRKAVEMILAEMPTRKK